MSDLTSRFGADTESYVARAQRRAKSVGTTQDIRALMDGASISDAAVEKEAPATTPVIPRSVVEDNLRRIKAAAQNTLIRVNADGTRSYFHDIVSRGDGMIDTLRTDRGEGTRDSLSILSEEGTVKVAGLLAMAARRDKSGRFTKAAGS
jgi:hypothetical protein